MRQSRFEKSTLQVLLVLTIASSGAGLAAAQDAQEGGGLKVEPVLQEAKRKIGPERIILRSEYFDLRRRNPADPDFDASEARIAAVAARDRQALTSPLEAPNTGSVWLNIGPAPIMDAQTPQDFQQPSPTSGRLTDISIDPTDGRIYAGAAQGGIWRSDDNGATWTPLTDALQSLATGSIALDPSNPNTIYYGMGRGTSRVTATQASASTSRATAAPPGARRWAARSSSGARSRPSWWTAPA